MSRMSSLRLSRAIAMAGAIAFATSAMAAPLPADLQLVLSSAAQAGDRALVDAVVRAIQANPALADDIVQEAFMQALEHQVHLNPQASTQILDAARGAGIPMDPARVAGIARNAGVSFGGGATVAAAGMSPVVVGGIAAVAVGGIAAAAGGGGGSDGGGAPPAALPGDFETAEYNVQYGLGLINASSAYARGATGAGIVVGVIDTGLDTALPEFAGRIVSAQNFAGDRAAGDVTDDNDHGTHVAGIIAAAKNDTLMHGVAYDASIMPLRVFEADGSSTVTGFRDAFDYARTNGADVINGSYGQQLIFGAPLLNNSDQTLYEAMKRATDAGVILVFATGNDGDDNPTSPAIYPYVTPANSGSGAYIELEDIHNFSALSGMLLAVTAVDSTGTIAGYANRCGVAQSWCLAAPGSAVLSTIPGGSDTMSGTSMAAPHVSGAIAVLLDLFPTLTPAQVVQLLLTTADDSFAGYDAAVYGQGLLNLAEATRPLGVTAIPLETGEASLADSAFTAGGAMGDALLRAAGDRRMVFLDSLGRAYSISVASLSRTAAGQTLETRMDGFAAIPETLVTAGGARLSFTRSSGPGETGTMESARFRQDMGNGETVSATFGTSPAAMFGLAGIDALPEGMARASGLFAIPHLDLGEGTGIAFSTRSGWTFGGYAGEENGISRSGGVAEYRHASPDGRFLAARLGLTREAGGLLGEKASGAFAFASGTPTLFGGLSSALPMAHGWQLLADAGLGVSFARGARDSLITAVTPVSSMAWSLGLSADSIAAKDDRLVLSLGQPLHVVSGRASFRLPESQSADGRIGYGSLSASLAPETPETRLSATYERGAFGGMLSFAHHPGSISGAPDEAALLLRYRHSW